MIAKKIHCLASNNNFTRLANYITDAKRDGEKTLFTWIDGCMNNSDYELAVQEIEAVQELNTRTKQNKSYHLIISFRPEDSKKLTQEMLRSIEASFSEQLGLATHQRIAAVHRDTANIHMHIAYNLIDPIKLTMNQPFRDFVTLSRVCRNIEQQHRLVVDNGIGESQQEIKITSRAADREAQTGEQSFERYALQFKEEITAKMESAHTWEDVHSIFECYGMRIKPRGNGLAISDIQGKTGMKASTLDRSLSFKKMVEAFGPFAEKTIFAQNAVQHEYTKQPLQRGAKRAELFNEYKTLITKRVEALREIKDTELTASETIKSKWQEEKKKLISKNLSVQAQRKLLKLISVKMQLELAPVKAQASDERSAIKEKIPFSSWNSFLQQKARVGDEMALAILRSKKVEVEPETPMQTAKIADRRLLEKQREILTANLRYKTEKALLNVVKMSAAVGHSFTYDIDKKGVVLFSFPGGAKIHDYGNKIAANDAAREIVSQYVKSRWGKRHICESGVYRLGNLPRRGKNIRREEF